MSSNPSGSAAAASSSAASSEDFDKQPLWRFVTKVDDHNEAGGNLSWSCNFCQKNFKSSYTRVKAHLLKIPRCGIASCKKVPIQDLSNMHKLENDANERAKKRNEIRDVPLPPSKYSSSGSGSGSGMGTSEFDAFDLDLNAKKRKMSGKCNAIEKAFNLETRDQLDLEIARMFYSAGLPFTLSRNPYFIKAISFAANNNLTGYKPPQYNLLRTTLLQREKSNILRLLEHKKDMWKKKGVSIVSDGWSDSQRRPLINFMAVTNGNPMFLKAVDCSGETKDKNFIAKLLRDVIHEVGHENVVQVITDNASNCKGAGQIIESQWPSITWTPCVVHTLNLALKNICAAKNVENNLVAYEQCSWITEIVGDVMQVKNFIMNHSMRLAIFNDFVNLKLLSVVDTRFASAIVMLRRFKLIKTGLQSMMISEKWSCYRDDDVGKARFCKEKVLDDMWWESIDYILRFTGPIYDMIRVCDTDKPCLHLVYDMWDTMIENVRKAIYMHEGKRSEEVSTFYDVVHGILVDRWTKNNTPLHCMAHSLNPRYYTEEWLQGDLS